MRGVSYKYCPFWRAFEKGERESEVRVDAYRVECLEVRLLLLRAAGWERGGGGGGV